MSPPSLQSFGDREYRTFMDQGYLRLGKLLSPQDLAALQERADAIMMGDVRYESMRYELDSKTGSYEDRVGKTTRHEKATLQYRRIDRLDLDRLFLAYMRHPLFRAVTRRLIGENVASYRAMLFNKPARQGTELPWHRDSDYKGFEMTNVWTALDSATVAKGCMQIVPGSNWSAPENWLKEEPPAGEIVDLEADPGEAILLHGLVAHRSGVNPTPEPRRAFAYSYVDAAAPPHLDDGHALPLVFGSRG